MDLQLNVQKKQSNGVVFDSVEAVIDISHLNSTRRPHVSAHSLEIIIAGGGLGGLSAAIYLLKEGHRVTIFEKNERCGGRMNCIDEAGFKIDMGPTLLMMPEVIEAIFAGAGRNINDYLDVRSLDPAYEVRFPDGLTFEMGSDIPKMQEQASKFSKEDAARIPELFAAMQKQYENARFNFIEKSFNGVSSLFRSQTLKGLVQALPITSVYNFVSKYIKDDRLKQVFTFQTLYLGISPKDCPSIYALLPYIEQKFGVWFPMGGMVAVADGLVKLVTDLGGVIHTNSPVSRIVLESGKAVGVEVNDPISNRKVIHYSDIVVANIDTPTAYTKLIPASGRRKYSNKSLERKEYGCSGFLLYLGVKDLDCDFRHHEVILSDDYAKNLDDITNSKVIPSDPAIYVCIPTRTDPSLAPTGHDCVYVLTPCPNLSGSIDWEHEGPRLREIVLDKLENVGMKDLRSKIVFEKQFTPVDFESAYGCFQGSAFSMSPRFFQSSYFRPQMRSEEVKGLYFVGAGTHPGGGVPIVLTSGRLVSETIAEDLPARHFKAARN